MVIRTFIAIEIPAAVQNRIAELQDTLGEEGQRISWIKPRNIHLTLKFLGDTPEKQIEAIGSALERTLARSGQFEFAVRGLSAFPNLRRARVLWVGVEKSGDEFARLAKNINDELIQFGFAEENRKFTPHLTLGRVKSQLSQTFITAFKGIEFVGGKVVAQEVTVMRSDLRPAGAVYTPLKRMALADS